ncbi:hypothetical protein DID76_04250 [Candidatus Marinamargulisbacteria bacterium SCGC AG-414-C22]|nr:hypothetical protein DID76_04250 [Candidatus Marinamargulisbacteria bacterium SCGC AG-414-C22]
MMKELINKLNQSTELSDDIMEEYLHILETNTMRVEDYIDNLLLLKQPMAQMLLSKGLETFLPSFQNNKEDTDDDIPTLISEMSADLREKDINYINHMLTHVKQRLKEHKLPITHPMMIIVANFAFLYSGVSFERCAKNIVSYIQPIGQLHSPVFAAYDQDEQDDINMELSEEENLPKTMVFIFQCLYFFMGTKKTTELYNLIQKDMGNKQFDLESYWLEKNIIKKLNYNNPFHSFVVLYTCLKKEFNLKLFLIFECV